MLEYKIRISKIKIMSIVVFFLSINVSYLNQYFSINQTYVFGARMVGIGIFMLFYLIKKKKVSKTMYFILGLCGVIIFSSIMNGVDLSNAAYVFSRMIFLCAFYDYNSFQETRRVQILESWNVIMGLLSITDVAFAIIFPQGLYSTDLYSGVGLLGYKTERIVYSLTWVVINAYLCAYKKEKITIGVYLSTIVAMLGTYLADATGASLCLLLVMGLFVFVGICHSTGNVKLLYKIFNYKTISVVYVAVFIVVVIIQDSSVVTAFVQSVLGKSATLTGRTNIWKNCLVEVMKQPILGLGFIDYNQYIKMCMGIRSNTNAHNFFVSLLVSGGIVAMIVYFMIIKYVAHIDSNKIELQKMTLIVGIIGSLFIGITSSALAFCPFAFIFYLILGNEKFYKK